MELNQSVFDKVAQSGKEIVVVTKYFDKHQTENLWERITEKKEVIGVGENRIQALENKKLPRKKVHFIGRLQSRQIPEIVKYCGTIHSLANLKHARILDEKAQVPLSVFVQVNVAADPSKEGIMPEDVPLFLDEIKSFKNLKLIGLSSMGWGNFDLKSKQKEFQDLITLRDQYCPTGKTSAGTSRDYEIALEQGIDIVRVGGACFIEEVAC